MNGDSTNVDVLAERIANLSARVAEQAVTQQTAISAALASNEKAVNAAFAASEKAISKTEQSQKESNQTISLLQNDVVRLKESQAGSSGSGKGMREMYGWAVAAAMFLVTLYVAFHK
jgi:preprotein translocase subunit SecF